MSTTITENQALGIFQCQDKMHQHSKLYEKSYSSPDVVEHLRTSLFHLAKLLGLEPTFTVDSKSTGIVESYVLKNNHMTLAVSFTSYNQSASYLSLVKNPCTFLQYNKHTAALGVDIDPQVKLGTLEFLNSLMYLHRREYAFNCDYDDGYFDIRFESRKSRFNVDISISLN